MASDAGGIYSRIFEFVYSRKDSVGLSLPLSCHPP